MSNQLESFVADKKETIENVMEILQQGAEILASTVGELFPIFQIAAPIVQLALDNVDSNEAKYVKEQFQIVKDKIEVLTEELEDIAKEIAKSKIDLKYSIIEETLESQFRKYMDILNAKPQFRDVKKNLFLDHYSKSGGSKNLYTLYDAVMGNNSFGESILDIAVRYEQNNRRVMEDFCARLKKLFCLGLIALMGHAAVIGDDHEAVAKKWHEKMQDVENKMKDVINNCIESFAEQAQRDTEKLIKDSNGRSNRQLAKYIHNFLKKKYDWINWSVRVYNHSSSWQSKEKYHFLVGKSQLENFKVNNSHVVISYTSKPQPIDKDEIRQLMEGLDKKTDDSARVVEYINENMPGCVIHAVARYRDIWAAWNFPEECYYWENYRNVTLYVHSE
ncbi:protein rapunzel-like [Protopterus annectens]|uniref:protein rapunzel-like n=1 Tax=Protopterus annectens TaxID=7888 RepID=UPI001CFAB59D|nr:protein rapunzel-like [Protopterus annectens]